MEILNEKNIRFEALQQLREIQANMVGVSFLPVIGVMKESNPYIKDIIGFQDKLDSLTLEVQQFISEAKNGVDYSSPEDSDSEEPKEDDSEKTDDEESKEESKEEESKEEEPKEESKDNKKVKKPEDSSEPKV